MVGKNLTKCEHCGSSTKYLSENMIVGVASQMVINCITCNNEKSKYMKNIMYLKKKISEGKDSARIKGLPKKKITQSMNYIKKSCKDTKNDLLKTNPLKINSFQMKSIYVLSFRYIT